MEYVVVSLSDNEKGVAPDSCGSSLWRAFRMREVGGEADAIVSACQLGPTGPARSGACGRDSPVAA